MTKLKPGMTVAYDDGEWIRGQVMWVTDIQFSIKWELFLLHCTYSTYEAKSLIICCTEG